MMWGMRLVGMEVGWEEIGGGVRRVGMGIEW
jgi:hypothetical protein